MFKSTLVLFLAFAGVAYSQIDTTWGLSLSANAPVIAFDAANSAQEVIIQHDVTGLTTAETATKYLTAKIMNTDCVTEGTAGAILVGDAYASNVLTSTIDVNNTAIVGSSYYTGTTPQTAIIKFCLRVDYWYDADGDTATIAPISMTYHETNVELTINLNTGFSISSVAVQVLAASTVNRADLTAGYVLNAYHCTTGITADVTAPTYDQDNSLMSICVAVADASTLMYVNSIRELTVDQTQVDLSVVTTDLITSGTINAPYAGITEVDCSTYANICKIRSQLSMAFFEAAQPLVITGTAEVAFGQERERRLETVPLQIRYLGESTTTDFSLTAEVKPLEDEGLGVAGTAGVVGAGVAVMAAVALVAVKVLGVGAGAASAGAMGAKAAADVGAAGMAASSANASSIATVDVEAGSVGSGSLQEVRSATVGPFLNVPL